MANHQRVFNWQFYLGFLLVLTGGIFLADQLLESRLMAFLWPLLILLFGLTFFWGLLVAGKKASGLAIPGAVISALGILLFIQNTFNLWITWAYAWALLISAIGLGMLIMNAYIKRDGLRIAAGWIMGIGLVLFVIFGVLFEIILNIAGSDIQSGIFLGAGLILFGFFVAFSGPLLTRKKPAEQAATPGADKVVFAEEGPADQSSGDVVIQQLSDGTEFTSLYFKCVGDVFLLQGDACDLRVEGDPGLIKQVKFSLQDDVLKILYDGGGVNWEGLQWISVENRLRYYVTVKELQQLHLGGAGTIRAEELSGDHLVLHHAGIGVLTVKALKYHDIKATLGGLGEIRVDGSVESQVVELSGGGSYQAVDLRSQAADIHLSGAGSARVWVEGTLNAQVSGAGNILYKGEPQVEKTVTGLGGVKPL